MAKDKTPPKRPPGQERVKHIRLMLRELYLIHLRLLHTVPSSKLRKDCGEFNTAEHMTFLLPLMIYLSSRQHRYRSHRLQ
jgi:hypothetical protein